MKRRILTITLAALLGALPAHAQQDGAQGGQPQPNTAGQEISIYAAPEVFERAATAYGAGDFAAAALNANLYILLNPTHNRGYFVRALSSIQQDQPEAALSDLTRVIELTGSDEAGFAAQAFSIRAAIHREQGDTDAAFADYTAAIELNPIDDSYFARALLYRESGDLESALSDLDSAVELAPDDPVYPLYRSLVNNALGNTGTAAADALSYIELTEQNRNDAAPLEPGAVTTVEIAVGTVHAFPIQAEPGVRLTALVVAESNAQVDPIIVLLAPDGTPLISDDDGTGALGSLILDYPLDSGGTYTLLLTSTPVQASGSVAVGIELIQP